MNGDEDKKIGNCLKEDYLDLFQEPIDLEKIKFFQADYHEQPELVKKIIEVNSVAIKQAGNPQSLAEKFLTCHAFRAMYHIPDEEVEEVKKIVKEAYESENDNISFKPYKVVENPPDIVSLTDNRRPREIELEDRKDGKEKTVEVCQLITDSFIAEEVYDPPNLPQFVIYYFDEDRFEYRDKIYLGETDSNGRRIVYTPVFNDHVKKGMVILPRKPVECTIEGVVDEALSFVFEGFDSCGKDYQVKIITLLALASWILDKEKSSLPIAGIGVFAPIIAIRGPSGSGKNRLANMLRFISYHPFFDVSTYRIPSLYRPLDIWKGTLVIDEGDMKNTNENSELIHFLNSRATGTPISRQNPNNPAQCDAFTSFGTTIITQRRHFDDNATEGRTIPFYSDVTNKEIPTLETEELIQKGMMLQDKLLYVRMKYWDKILIDKTLHIKNISDHRLNSTLIPIVALSKFAPKLTEIIEANVKPLEEARRRLKAQSLDGIVINSLWELISEEFYGIYNNLYYVGREEDNGSGEEEIIPLTTTKLSEKINLSNITIRKIITSLNISPEEAPNLIRIRRSNYRPIFFDPYKLEKRLREFVVGYENNKLFEVLGLNVTDVTNVTDNFSGREREEGDFSTTLPHVESVTSVTSVTINESGSQIGRIKKFVNDLKDIYSNSEDKAVRLSNYDFMAQEMGIPDDVKEKIKNMYLEPESTPELPNDPLMRIKPSIINSSFLEE